MLITTEGMRLARIRDNQRKEREARERYEQGYGLCPECEGEYPLEEFYDIGGRKVCTDCAMDYAVRNLDFETIWEFKGKECVEMLFKEDEIKYIIKREFEDALSWDGTAFDWEKEDIIKDVGLFDILSGLE